MKTQWYESELHPVVGTSLLIEVDLSTDNEINVLGLNES